MILTKLKYFFVSLLTMFLVASFVPVNYVQDGLKPYYDDIMFLVKAECKSDQYWYPNKVAIYFDNLEGVTVGSCEIRYPYEFRIKIDRKFFNSTDNDTRLQLMAHELRHCLFQQHEHSTDPRNYMYYDMNTISKWDLYQQIIQDLEKSCKQK